MAQKQIETCTAQFCCSVCHVGATRLVVIERKTLEIHQIAKRRR